MRRILLFTFLALVLIALVVLLPPAVFLSAVGIRESHTALAKDAVGTGDASRLSKSSAAEVIPVDADPAAAEKQLTALVQRAAREGRHITISGARHSMGGHTLYPGGIALDMLPFHAMALDEKAGILTVGAGARWGEVIPFLNSHGYAVGVMQSNNDFSVGGSLSVNCHGWQHNSPPIASTVESIRVLRADGTVATCSRKENPELFSLVLGGYGLFGVILEAKLRVVSNEFYSAEAYEIVPANYSQIYHSLTQRKDAGMAYGRISVAPGSFLNEAVVVLLKRSKAPSPELLKAPLRASEESTLKRLVFRGSVGSDYGKNLRWQLEKLVGQKGGSSLTRNQIMNEPSEWFANRDPDATEILHEYFIPTERLWEFIKKARPVFLRHKPDLLNITVRNVEPDEDTFLCYAREEVFGLVMLFHQKRGEAAENAMRDFTRELIDVALDCGGTYYLPYRPHATLEQFKRGYPQARKFFRFKQLYDPDDIFVNEFFEKYGKPLLKK